MKPLVKFLLATSVSIAALSGCAIVPAEPGYVYAAPPPPAATVIVRPAYRPYHYGYGWRGRW